MILRPEGLLGERELFGRERSGEAAESPKGDPKARVEVTA